MGAASLLFAIPIVTFVSLMVVFPILFYGYIAIIANFAPIPLLIVAGLSPASLPSRFHSFVDQWKGCAILWVGAAYGLAHMGDAAATMGARNEPYLKVLFIPYVMLYDYLIG